MEGSKVGSGDLRQENLLRPRRLYRWKMPLSKKTCHFTPIFIHKFASEKISTNLKRDMVTFNKINNYFYISSHKKPLLLKVCQSNI